MVHYKPLLMAMAIVSTVVASPCKPNTSTVVKESTTIAILDTTTTMAEESTTTAIQDTTTTVSQESTTTAIQDTTTTVAEESTTTVLQETTTSAIDVTTTTAPTTTTSEADLTTTTTAPETTTSAPAPPDATCGITGFFLPGQALTFLNYAGIKASAKECLEGCAAYSGCEVIAFYTNNGRCEYFKGDLVTNGEYTVYQWYELGCLASM
ncbi:hypothetical protein F66182_4291 [Fusarium sp. NRRL 66182]|nr:hypothetical protein F66182_4291 [Fusarium sp. NRRL 66182]